jgi:hypothetical protein
MSQEFWGPGRATRVFRVDTRDQPTALDHPSIPTWGSPHPDLPGLLLFNKQVGYADDGGSACDVTCEYSSPNYSAGSTPPPPPRDDALWTSWSVRFESVEVEMPVFDRTRIEVNGQTKTAFLNNPIKILETRTIRSVSLTLNELVFSDQEAIAAQANKLHTIQGGKYRFVPGDVIQRGVSAWDVTYSWIDDRGTPIRGGIPEPNPQFDRYLWYVARPPHGLLVVLPSADPFDGKVPAIGPIVPYADEPNGHLTLPGASKIDFVG